MCSIRLTLALEQHAQWLHAGAGRSGWALMLRRCQGVVRGNKQPPQAQAVRGMSAVAIRSWLGFGLGLGLGEGTG